MSEAPKEDPRVLFQRLELAEKKSREFKHLASALYGIVSDNIVQMEVGDEAPPQPPRRGWLTFQKRRPYESTLVTHTKLDEADRARLREALQVLADEEAQKARQIAAQLGTRAKV